MKLLFFDLETTGTNPARHGIHQISGIVEIDGVEQERFDFKVRPNPKAEILDEALAVGGVTREEIDAYPPMEEVYCKLVALLSRYVNKYNKTDKFFLVGYNNASFDNQFLRGFFLQNGDNYFGSWFWSNSVDVMVLASQYLLAERPLSRTSSSRPWPRSSAWWSPRTSSTTHSTTSISRATLTT